MKTCYKCLKNKDLTEFQKDRNKKDGVRPICKTCCRFYKRLAYQKRPKGNFDIKKCDRCCEVQLCTEFSINRYTGDGLKNICKSCDKKTRDEWNNKNPEKIEKHKKTAKIKKLLQPKKPKKNRIRKSDDPSYIEKYKKEKALYDAEYSKLNPGKRNAATMKRYAAKLNATPLGLTENHWKQIEWFYVEASRLTKETGIKHCVDHIIPLQGKACSGLHAPWNLQILTKNNNSVKNRKFDLTYENESWKNNG